MNPGSTYFPLRSTSLGPLHKRQGPHMAQDDIFHFVVDIETPPRILQRRNRMPAPMLIVCQTALFNIIQIVIMEHCAQRQCIKVDPPVLFPGKVKRIDRNIMAVHKTVRHLVLRILFQLPYPRILRQHVQNIPISNFLFFHSMLPQLHFIIYAPSRFCFSKRKKALFRIHFS